MEVGYLLKDTGKWMTEIERDASEFDAECYGKLLEKVWAEALFCVYAEQSVEIILSKAIINELVPIYLPP